MVSVYVKYENGEIKERFDFSGSVTAYYDIPISSGIYYIEVESDEGSIPVGPLWFVSIYDYH